MKQIITLLLITVSYIATAQKNATVAKISQPIELDGSLDEEVWKLSKPASDFWQYFPTDTVQAEQQTEVYFLHDGKTFYVGFKCYSIGEDYVVPTLKRDFRAGGNDNATLVIDPFNDRINAVFFGTNPYGVQREGLISGGGNGRGDFSTAWDNKWKCAAKIHDGYWTAEMAIPVSILRFNAGVDKWSLNVYRFDTQNNERSTWTSIPRNQIILNLAFMGDLDWDEAPQGVKGGGNSIIPYVTSGISKNYEEETDAKYNYNLGGDAKIAITPGLNLDLTFNPDFSQVEVDRQVTNVDRFEIFFPERRQFFLENADLFGAFGDARINPFFSRRIGVNVDTLTGNAIQNTIYAGARLSGKINENVRLGILTMETAADKKNGLPDYNYSIVSLQQKIFTRSNIGAIFVNKQGIGEIDPTSGNDRFNRVIGLDYNLATEDNTWTGKAFLQRSFSPETGKLPWAQGSSLRYNKRAYFLEYEQQYVGADFDAQVGFVPRLNFWSVNPAAGLNFYNQEGLFNIVTPFVGMEYLQTPGLGNTDQEIVAGVETSLSTNGRIEAGIANSYVYLIDGFDPTGTDSEELGADTEYRYTNFFASYRSNFNLDFFYNIDVTAGEYFNGNRYGVRGSMSYRFQPYALVNMGYAYNYFTQDHLEGGRQTLLLSPRVDLTFSKKLFLTTVVQYNSQITNMNLNARLQWRFAPVSDLFIVYTDNYFTEFTGSAPDRFNLDIRNRSLVAKVTYWLNM